MIFDQFKSLEAENYELFRRFSCFAGESCERSWANLLLYKDTYNWRYKVIENRVDAIKYALETAHIGDIIVLAGKGHETYQILGDRTIHLDEREIVAEALANL